MKKTLNLSNFKCIIAYLILFLYVFNGIAETFHVEWLSYIFSGLLIVLSLLTTKNNISFQKDILNFILIGILALIPSFLITNELNITIIGFLSSYVNLLMWFLFSNSLSKDEFLSFVQNFIRLILIFGIISAILGFYQTKFDSSIFGLSTSQLYSDEELLSSGRFVRRATALFGSAQNYGLFIGIAFSAYLSLNKKKNFFDYLCLIILLVGVFVSGSRSASVCVFVSIIFYVYFLIREKKLKVKNVMIIFCLALTLLIVAFSSGIFDERAIARLTNFDISPARKVYQTIMDNFDLQTFFVGKGYGYKDWTSRQLIGDTKYVEIFNESYASAESYIMLTILQNGIFKCISFLIIVFKNLILNFRKNNQLFIIILCLFINTIFTPSFSGMAISFVFWPILILGLKTGNNKSMGEIK